MITPALADANNGNWNTASRYARLLRPRFRSRLLRAWDGGPDDLMIALHARRSASSIRRFAAAFPDRPLLVVLTGTDLYRDLRRSAAARRSLDLASDVIVLHDAAPAALPARWRRKCRVLFQSASRLAPKARAAHAFEVLAVGHLRAEKDPRTVWRVARALDGARVRVVHVGAALTPSLAAAARAASAACPRYRWVGPLSHARTRQRISRAHLLLHPSRIEGSSLAVIEAVRSDTPVIASDCPGNTGTLGADYAGLFPVGDAARAAELVERAAHDRAFHRRLLRQCRRRAPCFAPEREARELLRIVGAALASCSRAPSV